MHGHCPTGLLQDLDGDPDLREPVTHQDDLLDLDYRRVTFNLSARYAAAAAPNDMQDCRSPVLDETSSSTFFHRICCRLWLRCSSNDLRTTDRLGPEQDANAETRRGHEGSSQSQQKSWSRTSGASMGDGEDEEGIGLGESESPGRGAPVRSFMALCLEIIIFLGICPTSLLNASSCQRPLTAPDLWA
ncbi:hypothetical protein OH77DRAFT_1047539 [Trametes cingulata]|nr:hypothetical protein OH77DRAFT_1047539 [Trametes cingulata]